MPRACVIAKNVADLHSATNKITKETALTEKGEIVSAQRRSRQRARHPHRLRPAGHVLDRRRRHHVRQLDQERRRLGHRRPSRPRRSQEDHAAHDVVELLARLARLQPGSLKRVGRRRPVLLLRGELTEPTHATLSSRHSWPGSDLATRSGARGWMRSRAQGSGMTGAWASGQLTSSARSPAAPPCPWADARGSPPRWARCPSPAGPARPGARSRTRGTMRDQLVVPGEPVDVGLHDAQVRHRRAEVRGHHGAQVAVEVVRRDVDLVRLGQRRHLHATARCRSRACRRWRHPWPARGSRAGTRARRAASRTTRSGAGSGGGCSPAPRGCRCRSRPRTCRGRRSSRRISRYPSVLALKLQVEQHVDVGPGAVAQRFQVHAQVAQHTAVDVQLGRERRAEARPPASRVLAACLVGEDVGLHGGEALLAHLARPSPSRRRGR